MLPQSRGGERLSVCFHQGHGRFETNQVSQLIASDEGERGAGRAVGFDRDRTLELRQIAIETSPQTPIQFRIAGLPNAVADANATKVDFPAAERKSRLHASGSYGGLRFSHLVHTSALLLFLGMARIKYHAVTWLKRPVQFDEDGIRR